MRQCKKLRATIGPKMVGNRFQTKTRTPGLFTWIGATTAIATSFNSCLVHYCGCILTHNITKRWMVFQPRISTKGTTLEMTHHDAPLTLTLKVKMMRKIIIIIIIMIIIV